MKRYPIIVLTALLAVACSVQPAEQEEQIAAPQQEEATASSATVPGEMIVEFSDDMIAAIEKDLQSGAFLETKSSALNSSFAGLGVISVERLYSDGGEWEPRHRKAGLHKWYRIKYDPSLSHTKASMDLDAIPGVVYTEPVRRIKSEAVFNDPYLSKQWHYINEGTLTSNHKKGCDIGVENVWTQYTAGSKDVIVAVIDGGVDPSHEDLGSVVLPGGMDGSRNFVSGGFVIKPHNHGTHVAGTIGAINNNGKGVCGVAGGNDGKGGVRIMSCQVFESIDGTDKDRSGNFYDAIVWAADHGAVIANNSWGHVYESEADALAGGVGSTKGAIDYFIEYAGTDKSGNHTQTGPMKGGLVVFSAGNDNWSMGWPAAYDAVIAVGAAAPDYTRAYYSNYGDWVDIAAPGGSVYYSNGQILSTFPGNSYGNYQGTSMACPHVSGVAALLVSYYGGPGFTVDMLKERLLGGARTDAMSPNAHIGPLVNAFGSFNYGSTVPPQAVSSHEVSTKSNTIHFEWQTTKDPDDKVAYAYMLLASEDRSALEGINFSQIPESVHYSIVLNGDLKVGKDISGDLTGLGFNTDYYTSVVAFDYSKNYSALSPIVKTTTKSNNPPVIETSFGGSAVLKAHESLAVDFAVSDPDGHDVTVALEPGSTAAELQQSPTGWRVTISGIGADPGTYHGTLKATDAYGASSSFGIEYQLLENHAPEVKGNIEDLIFEAPGIKQAIQMENYVFDPDGEQLTYTFTSSSDGIVHLNQVADVLNLTTLDYGLAYIDITGTDFKGESVSVELKVLVRDPASNPDVYPSVVSDYLNVSDGAQKTLSVSLTNSTGAVVYEGSFVCDAFEPARVDMRGFAPGRYSLTVSGDGKTYKTTIVKI